MEKFKYCVKQKELDCECLVHRDFYFVINSSFQQYVSGIFKVPSAMLGSGCITLSKAD